jgi:Zn-dependent protease
MARWSWKLGRVAGIDVRVHPTFLLLLAWVAVSRYLERHRWDDARAGVVLIRTVFGIVVLHELAHALTARRFGIRTRDITLLPIGGGGQPRPHARRPRRPTRGSVPRTIFSPASSTSFPWSRETAPRAPT